MGGLLFVILTLFTWNDFSSIITAVLPLIIVRSASSKSNGGASDKVTGAKTKAQAEAQTEA